MQFTLTVDIGNEAFSEGYAGQELARIMRELANKLEWATIERADSGPVHDINGNRVGGFEVTR